MTTNESDPPVFVIDLREEVEAASADGEAAGDARDYPLDGEEPVAHVAIVGEDGSITLRGILPTSDGRYLDALARLVRFAHDRGESVRRVASHFGGEYERRLLFERRLPRWALDLGPRPR